MSDDRTLGDLDAVLDDSEQISALSADAEPGKPRQVSGLKAPVLAGRWREIGFVNEIGLPADCPVIPLGMTSGSFYFLNALGEVVSLKELKAERLKGLFAGRLKYLYWMCPRWTNDTDKERKKELEEIIEQKGLTSREGIAAQTEIDLNWTVDGWDANEVGELLYDACAAKGVWRDFELVRGRGAWEHSDGRLLIHSGHVLSMAGPDGRLERQSPSDLGYAVYPGGSRSMVPWQKPGHADAAQDLLSLFRTWRWKRDFDAELLLGWVLTALVGGALHWRPAAYIHGGRGRGKSTLFKVMRAVIGANHFYSTNATAASVHQHIGFDASPVLLDEFDQALKNPVQSRALIALMRDAASGGVVARGGADHVGVKFQARNAWCFGSILVPPLRPQDASRLVRLNLERFKDGDREPEINFDELAIIGRKLVRRMMDRWADFKPLFTRIYEGLREVGHDSRGADQFGVLITLTQLALRDDLPSDDEIASMAARFEASELEETAAADDEWERCIVQILTAPVESQDWRQKRLKTVGQLLDAFANAEPLKADGEDHKRTVFHHEAGGVMAPGKRLGVANQYLSAVGLKLQPKLREAGHVEWWLAVPGMNELLRQHLAETDFRGEAGLEGMWKESLRTADEMDLAAPGHNGLWIARKARIDGRQPWCTWMRLDAVLQPAGEDETLPAAEVIDGEMPF